MAASWGSSARSTEMTTKYRMGTAAYIRRLAVGEVSATRMAIPYANTGNAEITNAAHRDWASIGKYKRYVRLVAYAQMADRVTLIATKRIPYIRSATGSRS